MSASCWPSRQARPQAQMALLLRVGRSPHLGGHHGRLRGQAVVLQQALDGVLLPQRSGHLLCAGLDCPSIRRADLHPIFS